MRAIRFGALLVVTVAPAAFAQPTLAHAKQQFDARNLRIAGEDLQLTLSEGSVFVSETEQGVTGLVLLGRGDMRFQPSPETEKGQVKIFCGKEILESSFDVAFVRINPGDSTTSIAPTRRKSFIS